MADFDSMVPDAPVAPVASPGATTNFDDLQDDSDKYGTTEQQLKAGAEGIAKGVLGPLAPAIETEALHVKPEDIRGRAQENPITSGVGEAAGLTGSMLTGIGEGAVMSKAGELAKGLVGLEDIAKTANIGHKVGAAAVGQAAEMAILQGSDEAAKTILKDPDASAQSAIANIGLSAALGGAGGAFMTGAVSPLWEATVGPRVESALDMFKTHLNGEGKIAMTDTAEQAAKNLGIEIDPLIRAGASTNAKASELFNDLRRSESKPVTEAIDRLHTDAKQSVANSLGVPLDQIAHYSENDAGHDLAETFAKEFSDKYGPVAKALEERDAQAAHIPMSDESRLDQYNQILEKGLTTFDANSPLYKEYQHWGSRILDAETVGSLDKITSELGGEARKAKVAGDGNMMKALSDIRGSLEEFKNSQIADNIVKSGGNAKEIIEQRLAANAGYKGFAQLSQDLSSHLNTGEFKGYKTFLSKLTNDISPEQLLNKFSPKSNADFIPFLEEHFPDTLQNVKANEMKKFLRTSVKMEDGEPNLNLKNLQKAIENAKKGKSELVNFALSPETVQKVQDANTLINSLPNPKNSSTVVGLKKLLEGVPTSAMAAVGWLHGHNPVASGILGKIAGDLGINIPEAYKLAYLRFISSDQPVKAQGFKSMVEFLHNSYKGQTLMAKGVSNVLKSGAQVLTEKQMPDERDREKLDKAVAKVQDRPNALIQDTADGHVGHYLPQHQVALTQTSAQAVKYLSSIKPQPYKPGPLDREIQPSRLEMNRYNRALDIAQQPAVVLQHVKDGTLQATDIADLNAMYPALYKQMSQQLSNEITTLSSKDEPIPYKTRVGISLLLGQPMDTSMTPSSIIAAQPVPKAPQQGQQGAPTKKGTTALGKTNKTYRTPNQAAEEDRSGRD